MLFCHFSCAFFQFQFPSFRFWLRGVRTFDTFFTSFNSIFSFPKFFLCTPSYVVIAVVLDIWQSSFSNLAFVSILLALSEQLPLFLPRNIYPNSSFFICVCYSNSDTRPFTTFAFISSLDPLISTVVTTIFLEIPIFIKSEIRYQRLQPRYIGHFVCDRHEHFAIFWNNDSCKLLHDNVFDWLGYRCRCSSAVQLISNRHTYRFYSNCVLSMARFSWMT